LITSPEKITGEKGLLRKTLIKLDFVIPAYAEIQEAQPVAATHRDVGR
jgi:argininosuccinate lyase